MPYRPKGKFSNLNFPLMSVTVPSVRICTGLPGLKLGEMGLYDQALRFFEHALRARSPDNPTGDLPKLMVIQYANALLDAGKYKQAVALLEPAVSRYVRSVDIDALLIEAYRGGLVKGFTTNPTLMSKAGITNYMAFAAEVLRVADLVMDLRSRRVSVGGSEVSLTPTEFDLLQVLMREPGRVFTRAQLVEAVYDIAYAGYDRAIDSHIKNLRQKIEPDPRNPRYILTVYGVGYRLAQG